MRRGHLSILRQAIAAASGTEVKNLGDGLMVAFASASAALSCAVHMQQRVDQDNRTGTRAVGLRIGLSGGEVTIEDGDYFGDPVVEAARLCAAGGAGQILASERVRGVAGRRNRHECRSLGAMDLKGLPYAVETVEVLWEPVGVAPIPLPGRLAVRPPVGVVGREEETETIRQAAKRVANGEGREIVLVSGEAGLGKTTLVGDAAREAVDLGAVALFGHCEEHLATPYQLFSEALGHYVSHAPEAQLAAHVDAHGAELARLVPALRKRIPDLPPPTATDADTERSLLYGAVLGLLDVIAEHQPVVVVLEDLQWADKASLLLLRHLASAEHALRTLVLGTFRDTEVAQALALRETLGALRRVSGLIRIELDGFDDHGVVAFMEAAAGHVLDESGMSLAHAVHRETDGNPFFVGEVLRHLSETEAIFQDDTGRWVTDDGLDTKALPDSVREVIGGRVVRLGSEAERALSMAAVVGRDFDLDLLARSTGTSEDDLLDILDAATTAALVRELADTSGRYSFSHALIQHTLYENLGPTRRAAPTGWRAEALEELCGDRPGTRVGELARHWSNAQPPDLEKAVGYAQQAGDAALAALAPADARRAYSQALDLYGSAAHPDPLLGIDLAIGLGTAQRQMGEPAFLDTLITAARSAAELEDTDRLVAAALATDRGFFSTLGTISIDKVDVLELALGRLQAGDPRRALVLATLCAELAVGTPFAHKRVLADEALAIIDDVGDDALTARVLTNIAFPLMVPSMLPESMARTEKALTLAERMGDPALQFFAARWRGQAACLAGDIDEMDRCLAIEGPIAARLDQPMVNWAYAFALAWRASIAGDIDQTEKLAIHALEVGSEGGQADASLIFGGHLIDVNIRRGTLGDLGDLLTQLIEGAPDVTGALTATLALSHAEAGRFDDAGRLLEEFAAVHYEMALDPIWSTGMVRYAEAATLLGDRPHCSRLFDCLAPFADQWSSNGGNADGPISHFLGGLAIVLGRWDEADAHLARAAVASERVSATFFSARTDLARGQLSARRNQPGDAASARHHLERARAVAVAHGYGSVERRAVEALTSLAG